MSVFLIRKRYRSDDYNVYRWLPRNLHKVGKGGEVKNEEHEGLHSVLRGKLNRLVRKTKGYSKSVEMLTGSLALVWLAQEWI